MGRTPKTDKEKMEVLQQENLKLKREQLFNDEVQWRVAIFKQLDYLTRLISFDLDKRYPVKEIKQEEQEDEETDEEPKAT